MAFKSWHPPAAYTGLALLAVLYAFIQFLKRYFCYLSFGLFTASEEACTLFMANGKDTSMDDQVDAKLERRGGVFSFFLSSPFLRLRFTNTRCTFSLETSSSSYSPRYFDDIGNVKNKCFIFVGEMGDSTATSLQSGTTVSYLP